MVAVSLYKPGFVMHSRKRFSHVCAHLHVAACGSSEGFRWQSYRTFGASTPVPRPRCEGKCREGRYGSSPQDDSPRSNCLPPEQAQADKPNSRTSAASTCVKETNTYLIPQDKQTARLCTRACGFLWCVAVLALAIRISRSAHHYRVQDCKIKPNAVKAVTALSPP